MRGKGGGKRGERDKKEDGGQRLADAVEVILCSICRVIEASSCSSQSRHSCHSVDPPTADGRRVKGAGRGRSFTLGRVLCAVMFQMKAPINNS